MIYHKIRSWASKYFNIVLNLIYPPRCIFCEKFINFMCDIYVCKDCRCSITSVVPSDNLCCICFSPVHTEGSLCSICCYKDRYFSYNIACFYYEDIVRDCILKIKIDGRYDLVYTVAKLMAAKIISFYDEMQFDLIVSVPSSSGSLRSRGFDLTSCLASLISRETGIPYQKDILFKDSSAVKQSSIPNIKDRELNVRDKFCFNPKRQVFGKSILLIDDIFTTGSTVNECSKILCGEGALSVCSAAFAVSRL